jgi:hypothetical protein
VITPRAVGLVRVPGLRAAHRALAWLACGGAPLSPRDRAVLLPSRTAAEALRRTIERILFADRWRPTDGDLARLEHAAPGAAIVWPEFVSRQELYASLHARAGALPPLLTAVEREVLLRAAADEACRAGALPPFQVRPGIVASMLELFESLGRLRRSPAEFERLALRELEPAADVDRGAARLLQQTRFLVAALRDYDARIERSGGLDEPRLRQALRDARPARPLRHLVIALADQTADPAGLWPADRELLLTLPGLERIDVIATEHELAAGGYERMLEAWPGIEERRLRDLDEPPPLLVAPREDEGRLHFTSRDREDELAGVVRRLKVRAADPGRAADEPAIRLAETALVYQGPLPYLYLASRVFHEARVPFQATDALPLAAEPAAAALDLVLTCALHDAERTAIVALLASPHLDFRDGGDAAGPAGIGALDRWLRQTGFTAGAAALGERLRGELPETPHLRRAARAALVALDALAPLSEARTVAAQVRALIAVLENYGASRVAPAPAAGRADRAARAGAAVREVLVELAQAHARFDDREAPLADTASLARRWIEARTIAPRTGDAGVHLVDPYAARFGRYDAVHLLGLVEGEWPAPGGRNIFYPTALLRQLGWPGDADRTAASRAHFVDLLRSARLEASVSTFMLEEDALVRPAVLLEDLDQAALPVRRVAPCPPVRVFEHEALAQAPLDASAVPADAASWLALRQSRSDASLPAFHGSTGPYERAAHSATALDTYRSCPFKYFASRVLRIAEDRPEEIGLDPLARGRLVHEVFERFFSRWGDERRGTITPGSFDEARQRFAALVEEQLASLPEADRRIETVRLLGSAAGEGMGDRVFRIEAAREARVLARELELSIEGEYPFETERGARAFRLRGTVDRVDRLDDGSLRVIDYKTGGAGELKDLIQLPLYVFAVERAIAAREGREARTSEAFYVGLRGRDPVVSVISGPAQRAERLAALAGTLGVVLDDIAAGEFPPRPSRPRLCVTCEYAAVCRKDYVGLD